MSTHHIPYDPDGRLAAELPPDRETHEQLVRTALAWSSPLDVPADDVVQVGHLLAGAAHVVAEEVRLHADRLAEGDGQPAVRRADPAGGRRAVVAAVHEPAPGSEPGPADPRTVRTPRPAAGRCARRRGGGHGP